MAYHARKEKKLKWLLSSKRIFWNMRDGSWGNFISICPLNWLVFHNKILGINGSQDLLSIQCFIIFCILTLFSSDMTKLIAFLQPQSSTSQQIVYCSYFYNGNNDIKKVYFKKCQLVKEALVQCHSNTTLIKAKWSYNFQYRMTDTSLTRSIKICKI